MIPPPGPPFVVTTGRTDLLSLQGERKSACGLQGEPVSSSCLQGELGNLFPPGNVSALFTQGTGAASSPAALVHLFHPGGATPPLSPMENLMPPSAFRDCCYVGYMGLCVLTGGMRKEIGRLAAFLQAMSCPSEYVPSREMREITHRRLRLFSAGNTSSFVVCSSCH